MCDSLYNCSAGVWGFANGVNKYDLSEYALLPEKKIKVNTNLSYYQNSKSIIFTKNNSISKLTSFKSGFQTTIVKNCSIMGWPRPSDYNITDFKVAVAN